MNEDRFPSGRLRSPLGVREGGAAYQRIHQRLAMAALRLLAERGFQEMGVDEVAQAAGASKRTVYRHYANKVDLAVAAIGELAGMFTYEQEPTDAQERLANFMRSSDERDGLFAPVLATAVVNRTTVPELLEALRVNVLRPREELLRRFIEEGQRAGQIRREIPPEAVAALGTGMYMDQFSGMHAWFGSKSASEARMLAVWAMIRAD